MDRTTERFWSKVQKTTGCWLWTASKRFKGYGAFVWPDGDTIVQGRAHRYSWILHHGPIPLGLCVLHHCDTPACVRPEHLFLGTKADNNTDMADKGRRRSGGTKTAVPSCQYKRGEEHHAARLTAAIVRRIREDRTAGLSFSQLGQKYGVSTVHAFKIVKGQLWKHVT